MAGEAAGGHSVACGGDWSDFATYCRGGGEGEKCQQQRHLAHLGLGADREEAEKRGRGRMERVGAGSGSASPKRRARARWRLSSKHGQTTRRLAPAHGRHEGHAARIQNF